MLKVRKLIKDQEGVIIGRKAFDVTAIVTDKDARKAEVIDIEDISIESVFWSKKQGVLQIHFSLGGKDTNGNYHSDPQYQNAIQSIPRGGSPFWEQFNLDNIQMLDFAMLRQWLFVTEAISEAVKNIWGSIEDVEISLGDQTSVIYVNSPKEGRIGG